MSLLRLAPSAVVTETEAGVLLRSDLGTFCLEGDDVRVFVTELIPLLDGSRDEATLAETLAQFPAESVRAVLELLRERGLVERFEPERERWHGQDAFLNKAASGATHPLEAAQVAVIGLEAWATVAALELAAAGLGEIQIVDDRAVDAGDLLNVRAFGEVDVGSQRADALASALERQAPWTASSVVALETFEADLRLNSTLLVIAGVPDDDPALLERIATFAQVKGLRSLHGGLDGFDAVLGPAVDPGSTACWKCTRLRLLANADDPETAAALERAYSRERAPVRRRTYLAPATATLRHLAALEAIKLLTGYLPSRLYGRQLVQNLISLETTVHTVIRVPWCPVCGGPSADHRTRSDDPEDDRAVLDLHLSEDELRRRLEGWVDSRTGIVRYLGVVTPDPRDPDSPVTATAVLSRYSLQHGGEAEIGSGKGVTRVEALIGACGEAIERYSAAQYRRSDLDRAAFAELEGDGIEPKSLALYEEWQYDQSGFPFDRCGDERTIDWTRGRWFDNQEPVWLPALPTYFNFHAPEGEYFCQVSSNGLAAGATVEDAELRAVYELLERDGFMLTWHACLPATRIVIDQRLEPEVEESVRQLNQSGAELVLYLMPIDVVPVVLSLAHGDGERWPGTTVSLAAASDLHGAIRKALLEQGHIGPYIRRLIRDERRSLPEGPESVNSLLDHALYYADPSRRSAFEFLDRGTEAPSSKLSSEPLLRGDVCKRVAEAGLRLAVADVTAPDVRNGPFKVARALGANIQPIDFGFSARRLGNPRLKALLNGDANPEPHPVA